MNSSPFLSLRPVLLRAVEAAGAAVISETGSVFCPGTLHSLPYSGKMKTADIKTPVMRIKYITTLLNCQSNMVIKLKQNSV
jgi:hypothetical protein